VDEGEGEETNVARPVSVTLLELLLGGDLTAEQESRLREVADRCPVHRALKGEVEISEKR
jgi:putative redox protein